MRTRTEARATGRIDAAITGWTALRDDYEAMRILQEAGVPAAPYLSPERVFADPQLREGGFFTHAYDK